MNNNTQIEENYLKALYHIGLKNGSVSVNELSKHLNIKMPTVNSMMKKMLDKGYIFYESYKPIQLTELGMLTAALIVRKHRLTEMYLVEHMGFSWDQVHDIAEQMEHITSPLFFDKMDELLNYPKFDPHGSPIPDKNGSIMNIRSKKLSEAAIGEQVKVIAVVDSSESFLKYLTSRHISIGSTFAIQRKEEYDGTIFCLLDQKTDMVISNMVAQKLMVEY